MTENCKNCGAPIDHAANKCAYCGTAYETPHDAGPVVMYADNRPYVIFEPHRPTAAEIAEQLRKLALL